MHVAWCVWVAVSVAASWRESREWSVFDAVVHRLDTALSDIGGIRTVIQDRSHESGKRALKNAIGRHANQPTFVNLVAIYSEVEIVARGIKRNYSLDLFDTKPFADLFYAANKAAQQHIPSLGA